MRNKFLGLALILVPTWVLAEPGLQALTVTTNESGQQVYSVSLQILGIMTALTLLPAILLTMTSFTRIIVVFSILRQALGLTQTPSNQILLGLALFLTFFVMGPVFKNAYNTGVKPYLDQEIAGKEAISRVELPIREFMLKQTRTNDLDFFRTLAEEPEQTTDMEVPFWVLLPAFVTSELKTAFQIGFLLFIPFLIIDLVVASLLMAMGMVMLSPLIISLPFKIMLFVLVDGWILIIGTLAQSFAT